MQQCEGPETVQGGEDQWSEPVCVCRGESALEALLTISILYHGQEPITPSLQTVDRGTQCTVTPLGRGRHSAERPHTPAGGHCQGSRGIDAGHALEEGVVGEGTGPVEGTIIGEGDPIDFTDLSTGNPTSWTWSFPGGTPPSSTVQHPTNIVYDTSGLYNVSLTVTNAYGTHTQTKNNYISVLSISASALKGAFE